MSQRLNYFKNFARADEESVRTERGREVELAGKHPARSDQHHRLTAQWLRLLSRYAFKGSEDPWRT